MEKSRETRGRLSQHDHQNKSKNLTAVLSFLTFLRTSSIAGLTGQKWQKSEIWTSLSPPAVTAAAPYPGRPSLFHLDGWSHLDGNDEAGHYMKLHKKVCDYSVLFSIKFFVSNQIWSFLAEIVCFTSLHGSLCFPITSIPIYLSQAFHKLSLDTHIVGVQSTNDCQFGFFQQVWFFQVPFFSSTYFYVKSPPYEYIQ